MRMYKERQQFLLSRFIIIIIIIITSNIINNIKSPPKKTSLSPGFNYQPSSAKMLFTTALLATVATLSLAAPTTPSPPVLPNPNDVYIRKFTYAGSGCPYGTVANSTDASKEVLTLLFSDYVASIGPGTKVADRRKNCAISLDIHYPQGYQYAIFTADYRGYADLEYGVTGEQQSTYYFAGQQQQVRQLS